MCIPQDKPRQVGTGLDTAPKFPSPKCCEMPLQAQVMALVALILGLKGVVLGEPYPLADGVVLDGQLIALGPALRQQVLDARQLLLQDAVLLLEGQQRGHGPRHGCCGTETGIRAAVPWGHGPGMGIWSLDGYLALGWGHGHGMEIRPQGGDLTLGWGHVSRMGIWLQDGDRTLGWGPAPGWGHGPLDRDTATGWGHSPRGGDTALGWGFGSRMGIPPWDGDTVP